MRKRTIWIGLAALVGLWLVPTGFVAFYDPSLPRGSGQLELPRPVEGALGLGGSRFPLLAHGYTKRWTIETWKGDDDATADKSIASYHVERGPLDRRTGTFRLSLSCSQNHAPDLEAGRLFVTSVDDWSDGDEAIWTKIADATVTRPEAGIVVLACEGTVPASATAYRLEEVRGGAPCCGFSQSMLTAPTALGRAYDTIAWLPIFRWVPALR